MKLFLVVCCTLVGLNSSACLNYYLIDERGHDHAYDGGGDPTHIYLNFEIAKQLYETQQAVLHAKENRFFLIADYAALLIKAGCSEEAVPILHRLLKDHPSEYNLYANLAVAYELTGQPDTALVYLNRSMKLNPSSHQNSEWVHQRILEYVAGQRGNDKDFSAGEILKITDSTNEKLAGQLAYQLNERVPLTPAPNELLSRVIEETGDFYRKNMSLEWALKFYAISVAYASDGAREQELLRKVNVLMPKLFELHKKDNVRLLVFSKDKWQQQFNAVIGQWKNYRPYEYAGPLMEIPCQ